ncbi:MAG TPA: sigma-70 family RNA polymerase sigma factor [Gemmataceae bacterium]
MVESGDLTTVFRRLRAGDPDARRELLGRAYDRLRRLAGVMLRGSFPALQTRHEPESVVNEACVRLLKAFDADCIPSGTEDFFRFAAFKVRQVLLDLAERQRRLPVQFPAPEAGSAPAPDPAQETYDPVALAVWGDFHARAGELPEGEREVFGLRYYLGVSQREIAEALDMHPKAVSRLWIAATERLADVLPEVEPE